MWVSSAELWLTRLSDTLNVATTVHQLVQQMEDGKNTAENHEAYDSTNCSSKSPGKVPLGSVHAWKSVGSYCMVKIPVLFSSGEGEADCIATQKASELLLSVDHRLRESESQVAWQTTVAWQTRCQLEASSLSRSALTGTKHRSGRGGGQ